MDDPTPSANGTMAILKYDNPLLRTVSNPVVEFDEGLTELANTLARTMIANKGVGISAIQVGVTKRVIIVLDNRTIYAMVNPVFVRKGNRMTTVFEGCLSLDRSKWRNVTRPAKCEIAFQDLQGNPQQLNLSGNLARFVQHEMDHLDGILIIDK